jgi:hypothetical protein
LVERPEKGIGLTISSKYGTSCSVIGGDGMRVLFALLVLMFAHLLGAVPAHASGDWGCTQALKLAHPSYSECDNTALLAPGNDTRVNLVLLMIDRHGPKGLPTGGRSRTDASKPLDALFYWQTMRDELYPKPQTDGDSYASGEGSRCRSNDSGASAFNEAIMAARKVPAAERAILIEARGALRPDCSGETPAGADRIEEAARRVKSSLGKAFARYLQGALAFYAADYDAAAGHFAALRSAGNPWLKETARYMLGRVEVNRAQLGAFDDYGLLTMEKVDQKAIDAAEVAFLAYLHDYPRGLYSASARGLMRRVYWLGGRTAKLAGEYAELFAADPASRGIDDGDLAEEIDNKLLSLIESGPPIKVMGEVNRPGFHADAGVLMDGPAPDPVQWLASTARDPILLAMADLRRIRTCISNRSHDEGCRGMVLASLEAQRAHFATEPLLFDYLQAVSAFYLDNRPDVALQLLGDRSPRAPLTYLAFSRQMLRGMALERLGRAEATNAWLPLLSEAGLPYQRPLLELAVARAYERSRMPARILDAGSPVQAPVLRETVITYVADAPLLRAHFRDPQALAHERDLALFILLYKELTRGAYRAFLADLALIPLDATAEGNMWSPMTGEKIPLAIFSQNEGTDTFDCPAIRAVATKLAADPADAHARLCVAEFARTNSFDYSTIDTPPPAEELGGTSLFPGQSYSRLEVYKELIADPRTPGPDKAYALYRAVLCYAPSGHSSCGGIDVPIDQRRAWFQRLKRDYPASPWAKDLKYYW